MANEQSSTATPWTKDVLFGGTSPSAPEKPADTVGTTAPTSAAEPPAPYLEPLFNSPERRDQMVTKLQEKHADAFAAMGEGAADRATRHQTLTRAVAPLPLDGEARLVTEAALLADLADRRGDPAPDEATRRQWSQETREKLVGTYGRDEAERLIARTQRFVEGHPALFELLSRRGLGAKAAVVVPLVEFIRREGIGR